jgi:hypothetical protein
MIVLGGEGALVVCQPVGALHGPAGQNRLWPELLWYAFYALLRTRYVL